MLLLTLVSTGRRTLEMLLVTLVSTGRRTLELLLMTLVRIKAAEHFTERAFYLGQHKSDHIMIKGEACVSLKILKSLWHLQLILCI